MNAILDDRDTLKFLASHWPDRMARRAAIALDYLGNRPAQESAKELGCSTQFVNRWRSAYDLAGVSGLVDFPRAGRPVDEKSLLEIHRFLESADRSNRNLELTSKKSGRSKHSIWRAARLVGKSISRIHIGSGLVSAPTELASFGIVGCYISRNLLVLAFQGAKPWHVRTTNNPVGVWLSPPDIYKKALAQTEANTTISFEAALKISATGSPSIATKPRAKKELWKRWLNTLLYAEPVLAESLDFLVLGDLHANECYQLLQEARYSKEPTPEKVSTDIAVSLACSTQMWSQILSARCDSFQTLNYGCQQLMNCEEDVVFAWYRL